jgi:hypothetical protein
MWEALSSGVRPFRSGVKAWRRAMEHTHVVSRLSAITSSEQKCQRRHIAL